MNKYEDDISVNLSSMKLTNFTSNLVSFMNRRLTEILFPYLPIKEVLHVAQN